MIIFITSLLLTSLSHAVMSLLSHGKFHWESKDPYGFAGAQSWARKYKDYKTRLGRKHIGSTTWLVWTTDLWHMAQMIMFISITASIVYRPEIPYYFLFPGAWSVLVGFHAVFYRILTKK